MQDDPQVRAWKAQIAAIETDIANMPASVAERNRKLGPDADPDAHLRLRPNATLPLHRKIQELQFKIEDWQVSHKLPVATIPQAADSDEKHQESELDRGARRQRLLKPLLKARGNLSINEWANEANLDWHTVDCYWSGKTSPSSKTRKALAQPLRIQAADLPE